MKNPAKIIENLFLVVFCFLLIYPFIYAVSSSLRTVEDYFSSPLSINLSSFTVENYKNMFLNFNVLNKIKNNIIIVTASVFLIVLLSIPSAYYISYCLNKKNAKYITIMLFTFMFIPEEVMIFEEYNLMAKLGLIDNFISAIIIFTVSMLPENIFLLTIFFKIIPNEVRENAILDGANNVDYLIHHVLPLSKSPIYVLIITDIFTLWNSFLVPMILLQQNDKKMLMPALSGLVTKHALNPTYQMAGVVISMLPMICLYLIFARKIFLSKYNAHNTQWK